MDFALMPDQSLVCLFGKSGSGKTRMLQAVEAVLPQGFALRVGVETVLDEILEELRNNQSIDEVVWHLREIDALLIDNLWLLASRRSSSSRLICDLIKSRSAARRLTIVTSDLSISDWEQKVPEIAELLSGGRSVQLS